jgi:hypothetical protein
MKIRYYISETYCSGHLGTVYFLDNMEQVAAQVAIIQQLNEPYAHIRVERQIKKWYQRKWETHETVVEWEVD